MEHGRINGPRIKETANINGHQTGPTNGHQTGETEPFQMATKSFKTTPTVDQNSAADGHFSRLAPGNGLSTAKAASTQISLKFDKGGSHQEIVPEAAPSELPFDPRPLHIRLQERQAFIDSEYDDYYRLSKRIKKIDDEDAEYYNKLQSDTDRKQWEIRQAEKQAIDKFKNEALINTPKATFSFAHRDKNIQKKILSMAIKKKVDNEDDKISNEESPDLLKRTVHSSTENNTALTIVDYESSD